MSYINYNGLSTLIKKQKSPTLNLKTETRNLLVVSHGGSATTSFITFIGKYIPTNCPEDLDGLKHSVPSKVGYSPSHIIYIYGDMDKTMRSLFRRQRNSVTLASQHEHKLKGTRYSSNLPANFENFEAYTKVVIAENKEPVGCLIHMRQWKKVPNVFFIHYEQICTSDTIDEYLGIPKGTCSKFKILPRESQIQPCETPEYLQAMQRLDVKVQGIISGQIHETNLLVVSFPRSGFHLLQTIFESYFSIYECACQKNVDVSIKTIVTGENAFHRAHDLDLKLNKKQFNKTVILYRKDIIESLDACFRYEFRTFDKEPGIDDRKIKHLSCGEVTIPYSEQHEFFKTVGKWYNDWVKKWVTEPTPNSILIEYSEFMKNPQITLDKLQEFLLQTKNSELSTKIVQELKIEFKHSMTSQKYKELCDVLFSLN